MCAEISFDLVMIDEMEFVEGTYRLPGLDWAVFNFRKDSLVEEPNLKVLRWASGVGGVVVAWPTSRVLNRAMVERTLGEQFGVTQWKEVRGPDSMGLR